MVVAECAPRKDLQDAQPAAVLGLLGGAESLDVGRLEQLGEDVGVWGACCLRYQVCGGAGRGCGVGEGAVGC